MKLENIPDRRERQPDERGSKLYALHERLDLHDKDVPSSPLSLQLHHLGNC